LWGASLVSAVGDWMQITGRAALVYQITGRTDALGLIYFLSYAPFIPCTMWGGVLADRLDRRKLLLIGQLGQLLGAAAIGVLAATGRASVWSIGIVSLLAGVVGTLTFPSSQALVPSLVPRDALVSAVSLLGATNSVARVIGPVAAAGIIEVWGIRWVFWLNAASFVATMLVWLFTRTPPQPAVHSPGLKALREGLGAIRRNWDMRIALLSLLVLSAVGMAYQPITVAFATEVLSHGDEDLGASRFGIVQGAIGVGALLGIMAVASSHGAKARRDLVITAWGTGATLTAVFLVDRMSMALIVFALVGAAQFANSTLTTAILQEEASEDLRGRVMAAFQSVWTGLLPLTALASGWVSDAIGTRATIGGSGLVCLAWCFVLSRLIARHRRAGTGRPSSQAAHSSQQSELAGVEGLGPPLGGVALHPPQPHEGGEGLGVEPGT
jgi:MFS family permease